ncbi:cryptochrome-1 [Selaginella moellendorffii]|nr:cryptochrome-1 [Selaginella moellendorffii]|eukprot:XP_002961252.2 cryptochrome-1 [Selaginella moellendorffii]
MGSSTTIVWFRRDLRVEDNPALAAASKAGAVVPLFIWCAEEEGEFRPGRVSRWWLKQSLMHLNSSLAKLGCPLLMQKSRGSSLNALLQIARDTKATQVFYNHLYDPVSLIRDHHVKHGLSQYGITVQTFNADLLYEPWELFDARGNPYTHFQLFWQRYLGMDHEPDGPLLPPKRLSPPAEPGLGHLGLPAEELGLEDDFEKSSNAMLARTWTPGWSNANKALDAFLAGPLADYGDNRGKVDGGTTSMLSPHLHYGELSIRKVFHAVRSKQLLWITDGRQPAERSASLFLRALGYREYSRYLCFHFPFTHERSLLGHLRHFPWRVDEGFFKAWRQGRTGYPLVDAGMRELWATGWLHNRIRVIVSSFCVKFLQLPWRWGMKYFWDTLLDADLESDILGWQYISGSLPDGHELDRMEIPHVEGRRFDPDGNYVRKWLPELSRLPTEWIHEPWNAPPSVLCAAGIELGCNYPRPVVEIAAARERLQRGLRDMWEHNSNSISSGSGTPEPPEINSDNGEQQIRDYGGSNGHQRRSNDQMVMERQNQQQQQRDRCSDTSHPDQIVPTLLPDFNTLRSGSSRIHHHHHHHHHHLQPQQHNFALAGPGEDFHPANHRQEQHPQQQQFPQLQLQQPQQQHQQAVEMMDSDVNSTAESSSAFRRNYDGYATAAAVWFPTHSNRRRVDFSAYL